MSRTRHARFTSDATRAYRRARATYRAALAAFVASGLDNELGLALDDAFFAMDAADADQRGEINGRVAS